MNIRNKAKSSLKQSVVNFFIQILDTGLRLRIRSWILMLHSLNNSKLICFVDIWIMVPYWSFLLDLLTTKVGLKNRLYLILLLPVCGCSQFWFHSCMLAIYSHLMTGYCRIFLSGEFYFKNALEMCWNSKNYVDK